MSAIQGYRAALSPIFALTNPKMHDSTEMNLLFKAFKKSGARKGIRPPHWDVNVVLFSLRRGPFEPMRSAGLKEATMKTLFLVALATANRVGEIQALADQVDFARYGLVLLSFLRRFWPRPSVKGTR